MGLILWLAGLLVLCGGALAAIWRRGRMIDDHPLCRRCGFDLVGNATATACPECGRDVATKRDRRIGNRRRSLALLAAALAMIAIGLGAGGVSGWGLYHGADMQRFKPVWMLRREAGLHGTTSAVAAIDELVRRLNAQQLSRSQVDGIVGDALAVQANTKVRWDTRWGDFMENAEASGRVSQGDLEQYGRSILATLFHIEFRPRVARGDRLPYRLVMGPARVGEKLHWRIEYQHREMTTDQLLLLDRQVADDYYSTGGVPQHGFSSTSTVIDLSPMIWEQLTDGPHEATWLIHARLLDAQDGLICEGDVTVSGSFTIVPAGTELIRPVVDVNERRAVRDALTVKRLEMAIDGRGKLNVHQVIEVKPRPAGVAFDIFMRDVDGREWPLQGIALPAGRHTQFGTHAQKMEGFTARTVDVIFRPSYDAAAKTVDVFEYWNEPIVFEDIAVDWSRVPAEQRPGE